MPHRSLPAVILALALAPLTAATQDVVVFEGVNVVPMDEERVLEAQTVVVRDGRIDSISDADGATVPEGAVVVDGDGRYLVPGLAEMHAHVPGSDDPRYLEEVLFLYVANGVTTARGMLGQPDHLELREQLARHDVLGPRLITSGPSLSGQSVSSPDDAPVDRLSLTEQGLIRYRLKTPFRDGTTHVLFEPLDFLARLAALVPPPRIHLTRFHGVFAPASRLRAAITPARRGRGGPTQSASTEPASSKHVSMTWMQRLKRVFAIDIDTCQRCGGPLKVLASIEDPELIANILSHLQQRSDEQNNQHHRSPATARAPPQLSQLSLL